jgi:hypothetical protein
MLERLAWFKSHEKSMQSVGDSFVIFDDRVDFANDVDWLTLLNHPLKLTLHPAGILMMFRPIWRVHTSNTEPESQSY